jgi:RNA polymerase sigma factor (TIGR02999 family)
MTDHDITGLLQAWSAGQREAGDQVFSRVYRELRRLARAQLLRGRPGDTLNTTAVVHEAYLKLIDRDRVTVGDRQHFFSLAARAMRQIIVDHARHRLAQKRGGGARHTDVGDNLPDGRPDAAAALQRAAEVLAVDAALSKLAVLDPRLARIVELRFFGGLDYEEIAEIAGCSVPTAKRDWARARAWLYEALRDDGPGATPDPAAPA